MIDTVEDADARIENLEIGQEGDRRNLELTLSLRHEELAHRLVAKISDVENVLEVRWAD